MSDYLPPRDAEEADIGPLCHFVFVVGKALFDENEEAIELFMDEGAYERWELMDADVWRGVLGYVESKLQNSS